MKNGEYQYPWGGEFKAGKYNSPVSVVTMAEHMELPEDKVALWGKMMTENLGVEKVVANVISNPNIRYVILFGKEIRGHKAGGTLMALHKNGVGEDSRIIEAPGAMPYVENLDREAVERFRSQVKIISLLDVEDMKKLEETIGQCIEKNPGSFGEPHIAVKIETKGVKMSAAEGGIAIHKDLMIDYAGRVSNAVRKEET
ncbi:MAG: tetrahydromethanopterin S-methyltransferase subunit A [Candidatus Thermoplasmatota archaeon]|nr:tetrahydromethanopterin S-methyltransferase subunit A [Candidatus Thermoplasmatota archaeon]